MNFLQVARPVNMKKETIQQRNRKLATSIHNQTSIRTSITNKSSLKCVSLKKEPKFHETSPASSGLSSNNTSDSDFSDFSTNCNGFLHLQLQNDNNMFSSELIAPNQQQQQISQVKQQKLLCNNNDNSPLPTANIHQTTTNNINIHHWHHVAATPFPDAAALLFEKSMLPTFASGTANVCEKSPTVSWPAAAHFGVAAVPPSTTPNGSCVFNTAVTAPYFSSSHSTTNTCSSFFLQNPTDSMFMKEQKTGGFPKSPRFSPW